MTPENIRQTGGVWPEYFQPRQGQETAIQPEEVLRTPTHLLDVFYMRTSPSEDANLVAVVGCLGGGIEAVTGNSLAALPNLVADDLQALRVNQRGNFRLITAKTVHIFRLDAIKQHVQADGFNDAVLLYGQMEARISESLHGVSAESIANQGRLTIGRLDLLQGIRQGITNALTQPQTQERDTSHAFISEAEDNKTYHFFLPTGITSRYTKWKGTCISLPND